jgi:predicted permease
MDALLQDLRYAVRGLRKSPGFTAAAILTLALGIGANTAIFSYVDATWLRPLPVRDPGGIVRIFTSEHDSTGDHSRGPSSYADYLDLRRATAYDDVVAYDRRGALLYGTNTATQVRADVVSANYFTALGLNAMLGRVFTEPESGATNDHSGIVISYELWRDQFGSDPSVAGKQVRLTRAGVTILGVMPRGFRGLDLESPAAVWIPMAVWSQMGGAEEFTRRGNRRREILARLRPNVSLAQAQAQLDVIGSQLAQAYPATNNDSRFTVVPEMDTRGEAQRRQGTILLAIALAVALIGAANLANLQLARAETGRRDTATRLAIGGSWRHLVRQWMAEGVLLSIVGCGVAVVVGRWIILLLPTLFASSLVGGGYDFRLDSRVLLFTIGIAGLGTIVFGLAPAMQTGRLDLMTGLRGGTTGGAERSRLRVRDALVVIQVAISLVLLLAASLLARTFQNLEAVDPGFNPRQNVLMLYVVPQLAYQRDAELRNYYQRVQDRLGALPGVQQASLVQRVPFSPFLGGAEKEIVVPGLRPPAGRNGFRVNFDVVGDGYFSLIGTRLLRGRDFGPEDRPDAVKAVIVNETMARRFWPGDEAVGQHFQIGTTDYDVVGVVENTKWETLTEAPRALAYFPITQQTSDALTILLRTAGDPSALVNAARAELRRINSHVPLLSAVTLGQHMDYTLNDERNRARLSSAFAVLGLVLAATGLYGILAFLVTRRTREIGIRIAVGAEPRHVFRLVLDYGLRRVAVGLAVGLALSLALSRIIAGLLYGVSAGDPLTLAGVLVLLVGVGALAGYVPARRAARIDPITALRAE